MEARDEARPDSPIQRHYLEGSHEARRDPGPERRKQRIPTAAAEAAEVHLPEGRHLVHEGVSVRPDLVLQRGVPGRERAPEEELQLPWFEAVDSSPRPGPAREGTTIRGTHEPEAQHGAGAERGWWWWRLPEGDIQGEVIEG